MAIFCPKIANFGPKSSVLGLGCSVLEPPTLILRCWTPKNMYCLVLKPGNGCFGAAPPKKWAFSGQKWPKNAKIGPKNGIIGPKTLFHGLERSVQGSPTLFCRWLTQKNINCMGWKPENKFFRAAPPKKWPLFGQKWPTIANFWQKCSVFGLGCSVQGPPTPFLRCWTPKNMCCMALKLENGCFRAAPAKKWPFFAQKWPKNAKIGPKTLFFGLGRSVQGPPTLFCRCLIGKKILCTIWKLENRCFRATPPKKWPFFLPKMA